MRNGTEKRRYLVHIRLGKEFSLKQRIREATPGIKQIIKKLSHDEYQLAYTSGDGGTFGFLMKASCEPYVIRTQLDAPGKHRPFGLEADDQEYPDTSPLRTDDHVLILEIGELFDGKGFSRAWTWLEHH